MSSKVAGPLNNSSNLLEQDGPKEKGWVVISLVENGVVGGVDAVSGCS